MADVNVNFPPSPSPARGVSAGDMEAAITQVKADVEGQVSAVENQINEVATQAANTTRILGDRLAGETNDNGRIQRLFNESVGGTCKIPSGTYTIDPSGTTATNRGVAVPSNINILMENNTVLQALPESTGYSSVFNIVHAENVTITGGKIIGERYTHTGSTGEWGMGIIILHSNNVTIDNTTIKDCWGDSVYIGGNNFGVSGTYPKNIIVRNCIIDNSRRQGISGTLCDGVTIENCRITNINGTAPEYGIDFETNNPENPCKNVMVKGCYFNGSVKGGFVIGSNAENINVDNCIFDGDNVNVNKCKNAKVTNCTIVNSDIVIASSVGAVISSNILANSWISIYTNATITLNTSITNNIFQNLDGDTSRKAITLTGTDNGCIGLNISGNSFYDFISETLYFFNLSSDVAVTNNKFKSSNVSRWLIYLKGYDIKFSNNNVLVDFPTSAAITNIFNIIASRGSFDGNTITWKNVTFPEAAIVATSLTGETVGMTISNNIFHGGNTLKALKLPSTGGTIYKVLNNDFRYTGDAIQNPTGHYIQGNILSTTNAKPEDKGTLTYNGDGVATSKLIPHGLNSIPSYFQVTPSSVDAGNAGIKFLTADATNIIVTFNNAPVAGTNNVKLTWRAQV